MVNELLEKVLISVLCLYGFEVQESENLVKVLDKTGVISDIGDSYEEEQVLEELNESMQKRFLRAKGVERQQLVDKFDQDQKNELLVYLSPFIKEINSGANASSKILLGGAENSVKERFEYLNNFAGHTKTVYSLGGERELWPKIEECTSIFLSEQLSKYKDIDIKDARKEIDNQMDKIFVNATKLKKQIDSKDYNIKDAETLQKSFEKETNEARIKAIKFFTDTPYKFIWPTETEMMNYIINNSYKPTYPNINFEPTINTPKKANGARPDTLDSLNSMWEKYGNIIIEQAKGQPSGKVVMSVVTTQPYGHYQTQQAITAFHNKPIEIRTLAKEIENTENLNLTNVLDSFARTIYAGKEIVKEKIQNSIHKNKWQNLVCISQEVCYSNSFRRK